MKSRAPNNSRTILKVKLKDFEFIYENKQKKQNPKIFLFIDYFLFFELNRIQFETFDEQKLKRLRKD